MEPASKLSREEFIRRMRAEVEQILGQVADAVSDGAPWIRNQVQAQSLPLDALGLDFYHLSEHMHKARREAYGEEDEAGRQ